MIMAFSKKSCNTILMSFLRMFQCVFKNSDVLLPRSVIACLISNSLKGPFQSSSLLYGNGVPIFSGRKGPTTSVFGVELSIEAKKLCFYVTIINKAVSLS